MENLTDEELIAWFRSQQLSQGFYSISSWETTPDLPYLVELGGGHIRRGNDTARGTLIRLKTKLEQETSVEAGLSVGVNPSAG